MLLQYLIEFQAIILYTTCFWNFILKVLAGKFDQKSPEFPEFLTFD